MPQLEDHMTVGRLKAIIKYFGLSDEAPVYYQRIEDSYFELGKGWDENSEKKLGECPGEVSQFVQAFTGTVYKKDDKPEDALYITAHY